MTLPPNIKEEIEKAAKEAANNYYEFAENPLLWGYVNAEVIEVATHFYKRGVGDRDAIAKAAFEAGRKTMAEIHGEGYGDDFGYPSSTNYLASDEYKKLVGGNMKAWGKQFKTIQGEIAQREANTIIPCESDTDIHISGNGEIIEFHILTDAELKARDRRVWDAARERLSRHILPVYVYSEFEDYEKSLEGGK